MSFDQELQRRLSVIRKDGLWRELHQIDSPQGTRIEIAGHTLVNFSSNDYLGLANHPALKEAAIRAVEKHGAGSGSARLISGSLAPHHELEERLAAFKGTEAALAFSSGYTTAIGTITALLGRDDVIILDRLVHACVVDAARLCGAKLRIFKHNDLNDLERILRWAQSRLTPQSSPALIVTDSIFSMDGDPAPLREIVELKNKYGAWLMVDEAHATGIYGSNRQGLTEELGVASEVEIQMGTLGKALGASGGYVCGSSQLIAYLVNRARSFIFSTAPVPAAVAAANAGIQLVQSNEGERLRAALVERVEQCKSNAAFRSMSHLTGNHPSLRPTVSAILPLVVGNEASALQIAGHLREHGLFVPAIRYPSVARGAARLRVTLTAAHAADDIATLTAALEATHKIRSELPAATVTADRD